MLNCAGKLRAWPQPEEHELHGWLWQEVSEASPPQSGIDPQVGRKSGLYSRSQVQGCKFAQPSCYRGGYGDGTRQE